MKRIPKKTEEEIIDLYLDRISVTEIAAKTKLFYGTIYRILKRNNVPKNPLVLKGEGCPAWKGGRVKTMDGYVIVMIRTDHPYHSMADLRNYVLEHRLMMAEHIGRTLDSREQVHHINGIRDDNRLENLQLVSSAHGAGIVLQCQSCGSQNVKAVEKSFSHYNDLADKLASLARRQCI